MSKKLLIFILLVCCFLISLYFSFLYFFVPYMKVQQGISLFSSWNYVWAWEKFAEVSDSSLSENAHYNLGTALYKQKNYSWSLQTFSSTSTWAYSFQSLHNLWNTAYYLWSTQKNASEKLKWWNQSLEFYSWALELLDNKGTKDNADFVRKKIDELNKQKNNSSEKSSSWSSDTPQPKNSGWTGSTSEETQSWSSDQSGKNESASQKSKADSQKSWTSQNNSSGTSSAQGQRDSQYQLKQWQANGNISESEREQLKNYQQTLEQFQRQNAQFYNKKPSINSNDDPFSNFTDPFTGKPLFQNNTNQNGQDW